MRKYLIAVVTPPLAVCRYGCAGCCAAPIGVFWLTGLFSLIYGLMGGPLNTDGISWGTVGLGATLWLIAIGWAYLTLSRVDQDSCDNDRKNPICRIIPSLNETDPMDEIKKAH